MNLKFFIAGMAIAFYRIITSGYTPLLWYWTALLITVTILNFLHGYKKYAAMANTFFFCYIAFITWERTRPYKFLHSAEYMLNNAEHILFALIVCLLAALFIQVLLLPAASFIKTLLLSVIVFNVIGIANEYFQNIIIHRSFAILTDDSQKDLLMNILGTALFIVLACGYHFNKRKIFPSKAV